MDDGNLEKKCLDLVNKLLIKYAKNPKRVSSVNSINSELIVFLFESITKHNIPDLLANETSEAEVHNVQAVIDTLSLDLLGISLSHITGEAVVAGNLVALYNLLEVYKGFATYMKSKQQDQRQNRHRILKRKISKRKKSSSSTSMTSLETLLKNSPSIETITQIECTVKNRINRNKKHLSPPAKSSVSPKQDSLDNGTTQNKIDKSDILSTKSLASLAKDTRTQSSISSINKADDHKTSQPGFQVQPSTAQRYPYFAYITCETTLSSTHSQDEVINSETKVKPIIHDQGIDLKETSKTKNTRVKPYFQVERASRQKRNVPTKEMHDLPQITIKRKIHRLSKKEESEQSTKLSQELEQLYDSNFENRVRGLLENNTYKTRASKMKNMHLKTIRKPLGRLPISACNKSFLLPYALRHRSISHKAVKRKASVQSYTTQSSSEQIENASSTEWSKGGFLQELFEEFPGLQLSPSIVNHITNKYQKHLLMMHKQVKGVLLKKTKTQKQDEEAVRKQALLDKLIKKDVQEKKHLKDVKEHKKFEKKIMYRLRDARLQSAKMKQYCDEFRTEMRKKVQKRNFSEELIFENLFKESLKVQKEKVDSLCQEMKETGENDARQHLIYLEALENLYQTQFALLSESLTAEKKDAQIRANAEQQEMSTMQREFQDELKNEIRFMQQVIVDCMEDTHFREMDAERFKTRLQNRP